MAEFHGTVELIAGITPKNGGDFALVGAHDVQIDNDGNRLDTEFSNLKSAFDVTVTDNYNQNTYTLTIRANTADRAITDAGGIVYSSGNRVVEYAVTPGDMIIATVADRSSETYKKVWAFYNGNASTAHLVGSASSDALSNTIIVVPSGVTTFAICQASATSTDNVKHLNPKVDALRDDVFNETPKYVKTNGTDIANSIIKSNYYGVKSSKTTIQLKTLSGYKAFMFPVDRDTYFYCDANPTLFRINTIENGTLSESGGTYTVTGTNPTEIKSGSFPTVNSKLLVPAGGYIIVTATNSGVLEINMSINTLSNELVLNTRQVEQAKAEIIAELGTALKSPSCLYENNNLKIFIPTGKGYIRYDFVHDADVSMNADVWRVNNAYSVDDDYSLLSQLTTSGEWECALHLQDRDDFSGGIAHGDEMVQEITFIIDGKVVSVSDLSTRTQFQELRIVELSKMYDPDDHTTQICVHGSEHIFSKDGLTINQNIIWSGSFPATTCYLAMFPPKKHGDDKVYMDTNYSLETLPSLNYRNTYNGAKSVTIFSDTANFSGTFEIPKYVDGTGGNVLWILDNGGCNYHKMYYVVTTGETVSNGTMWRTQTKYRLDVGE